MAALPLSKINSKLECPVCFTIPDRFCKIFLCPNNHMTCEYCYHKIENTCCPQCREQFDTPPRRNLQLEEIIPLTSSHTCRHPGCKRNMKMASLLKHEDKCRHRMQRCPECRYYYAHVPMHLETRHNWTRWKVPRSCPPS